MGFGFRAVISTFFADIFRNNALKNGLLPINQHGIRFIGHIAYHDFGGFEFDTYRNWRGPGVGEVEVANPAVGTIEWALTADPDAALAFLGDGGFVVLDTAVTPELEAEVKPGENTFDWELKSKP